MKAIILAAGQGTRLRPLTEDKPKCMVSYNNQPIIDSILSTMKQCHINSIAVVNGYKKDLLEKYLTNQNLTFYTNQNFDKTNMVSTLFCARNFMDDDVIISYADIIYDVNVLKQLMHSKEEFCVVIDKRWKELWQQRMEDPLSDAETLKITHGKITELGKKPTSYSEIEGQYIGLIKISKSIINQVIDFYDTLDKNQIYDGKDFNNMYMTSFIQLIIDNLVDVKPVCIEGGWVEVDCINDLNIKMIRN